MSASECRVFGGLRGNRLQNFQFESPKMKLHEFVRVPTVSDWAIFAVPSSKDEAPTPLITVGLLFIFSHLSRVHLTTLKIHSVSQTLPNFEQTTSLEVVNNSGKGYKSRENPIPICISRDASMERLLADCYRAVWGFAVRKKSGWAGAKWVNVVYDMQYSANNHIAGQRSANRHCTVRTTLQINVALQNNTVQINIALHDSTVQINILQCRTTLHYKLFE